MPAIASSAMSRSIGFSQKSTRMRGHVCGVNGADEARADQTEIDHAG
jgi:hypothetical protein